MPASMPICTRYLVLPILSALVRFCVVVSAFILFSSFLSEEISQSKTAGKTVGYLLQDRILLCSILRLRRVTQAASSTPPQCGPRGAFLFQRKVISYEKQKIPGRISRAIFIQKKDYTTAALQKNGSGHCSFSSFFSGSCLHQALSLFFHPDCNCWYRTFTGISRGFLPTVVRGLYRQWGLATPAPEDFLSLFFSISIYPVRNAVNRKIRLILLPHDCCALFHKVFPC